MKSLNEYLRGKRPKTERGAALRWGMFLAAVAERTRRRLAGERISYDAVLSARILLRELKKMIEAPEEKRKKRLALHGLSIPELRELGLAAYRLAKAGPRDHEQAQRSFTPFAANRRPGNFVAIARKHLKP